ncbi:hypothetical protein Tco_0494610 [Tanacetum coccineum]
MAWMGRNADIKDGDSVNLSVDDREVLNVFLDAEEEEVGSYENEDLEWELFLNTHVVEGNDVNHDSVDDVEWEVFLNVHNLLQKEWSRIL